MFSRGCLSPTRRARYYHFLMTDSQLAAYVQRANAGHADALQCLIVAYHSTLRRCLAGAIKPAFRRLLEVEDVLQQAYITAFRNLGNGRFEGPAHFYNWLEEVARKELLNMQRALRRRKRDVGRQLTEARLDGGHHDPAASYPGLLDHLTANDSAPDHHLGRGEAVAAIMSCLARLSDNQRAVVQLRFLEDVPVAEIARRINKTEAAVYTLCHRGLKSLRELMGSLTQYLTKP
jgi:RNA polymerase sigma-70 factor (subfamily 1)